MSEGRILFVEDDLSLWPVIGEQFLAADFEFLPARSGVEGFDLALSVDPSAVLLDLHLPDTDGLTVLRRLRLRNCRVPVLVVTSFGNSQIEQEARAAGATSYLEKPLVPALLCDKVLKELASSRPASVRSVIVGNSPALEEALRLADHLAPTDIPLLIQGESGTGKEMFAQVIHLSSPRRGGPFLVFDPSSVPETLLESALFGHERGAFTGAMQSARGVFEAANGGTLVIDEIGNLSLALQGKLLRVLQEHRFSPLGSNRQLEVDVRVLASTNVDLKEAVARGGFRLDLYHRLKGASLHLPPLRARTGDVEVLANHFLAQGNRRGSKSVPQITPSAMDLLRRYRWPGNIRELENAIAYAHSMARGPLVISDLPPEVREGQSYHPARAGLLDTAVLGQIVDDAIERGKLDLKRLVAEVTCCLESELLSRLARGRSQAALATLVGLDPATISRKLRSLGLALPRTEPVTGGWQVNS